MYEMKRFGKWFPLESVEVVDLGSGPQIVLSYLESGTTITVPAYVIYEIRKKDASQSPSDGGCLCPRCGQSLP